jgi:hypothetical protein
LCCRSRHRPHGSNAGQFASARGYHADLPFAINASGFLLEGLRGNQAGRAP